MATGFWPTLTTPFMWANSFLVEGKEKALISTLMDLDTRVNGNKINNTEKESL